MPPADRDLSRLARLRRRDVMSQSRAHAPRDAHVERPQRASEEITVAFGVLLREALGDAAIVGMRAAPATRRNTDCDGKREQTAPRLEALAARRPLHEPH